MRKVFLFAFIAIAAITLASFTTISHSPVKHHKTVKKADPAQPFNIQNDYTVNGTLYDPCTGEFVDFSGPIHEVIHGVFNTNTGAIKVDDQVNTQGVSGVGETSGNTYQLNEQVTQGEVVSSDGCSVTFTFNITDHWTTAGPANNFYQQIRETVTENFCTGTYTVKRETLNSGCQ